MLNKPGKIDHDMRELRQRYFIDTPRPGLAAWILRFFISLVRIGKQATGRVPVRRGQYALRHPAQWPLYRIDIQQGSFQQNVEVTVKLGHGWTCLEANPVPGYHVWQVHEPLPKDPRARRFYREFGILK